MAEKLGVQQEVDGLRQRGDALSEKIEALSKQRDFETRAEERIRLASVIREAEADRKRVETRLQALEGELKKIEKGNSISEAQRLERNKAYAEAIRTWEALKALEPEDTQIEREIQRLTTRRREAEHLTELIKQLTRRMLEVRPVYAQVVRRLKEIGEGGVEDAAVQALIEGFLAGDLPTADFIEMWQQLEATGVPTTTYEINFRALAARIRRGEIVLFLGSDIPGLFDANLPDAVTVVAELARQARYEHFNGTLSMIAEYYLMKPEYGRSSLVQNLQALLPKATLTIPLYEFLATVEQPLVLISAAYDTLLESAFRRTSKKYAVISSLLGTDSSSDVGNIVVHYSDREVPESPCLEENLSQLNLLGGGYSLIYKIRGSLDPSTIQVNYQQDTITLTEENYFTFARYMDKLIPNYVVKQFAGRGLLFLGYTPKQWEDRLIANALLYKRRHHVEPAYAVRKNADPFEETYWERHGVRRYTLELKDFVQKLEANFP